MKLRTISWVAAGRCAAKSILSSHLYHLHCSRLHFCVKLLLRLCRVVCHCKAKKHEAKSSGRVPFVCTSFSPDKKKLEKDARLHSGLLMIHPMSRLVFCLLALFEKGKKIFRTKWFLNVVQHSAKREYVEDQTRESFATCAFKARKEKRVEARANMMMSQFAMRAASRRCFNRRRLTENDIIYFPCRIIY